MSLPLALEILQDLPRSKEPWKPYFPAVLRYGLHAASQILENLDHPKAEAILTALDIPIEDGARPDTDVFRAIQWAIAALSLEVS